jgi:Zn-finger nucleic acid-binding protein
MAERFGIEIDYCPQCRGVWLDRGELDKIIERSVAELAQGGSAPAANAPHSAPPQYAPSQYDRGHDYHGKHHDDHQGYRGKHSFWRDLFD